MAKRKKPHNRMVIGRREKKHLNTVRQFVEVFADSQELAVTTNKSILKTCSIDVKVWKKGAGRKIDGPKADCGGSDEA